TADDLGVDTIRAGLRGSFGGELRVFDAIGSTNDDALEWAAAGAPEGAVVTADQQIQGRGRWNRSWLSPSGRSLSLSVVLRPQDAEQAALVTTLLGVAVAEAIEASAGVACGIKWPNDVVVGGRKVAGILVETRSSGEGLGAVVAGVGVNVSWGPEEMPPEVRDSATSLVAAGAGPLPRAALIAELLDSIERWYRRAATSEGRAAVIEAAAARSVILGHPVLLRRSDGTLLEANAVALLEDGSLQVDAGGSLVAVTAGEVERIRTEG
ncbi:MAG: biotin--[acetyl-CoA-carboxylase] ligase, partial [Actinomycetota bacterium]|nr:biotin--[acetyl-CoA-carboxylase] ligase [Actinomycetota bacterium]